MRKPSRLFWKLFLAFWLLTTLTFVVGVGMFMLDRSAPGDPAFRTVLENEITVLQGAGLPAGQVLFDAWKPEHGDAAGLYSAQGQLLAGQAVDKPVFEMPIRTREGYKVLIRATVNPAHDGGPSHWRPMIIGTVLSALFSWFLSNYLAAPLLQLRQAMASVARGRFDTQVKPLMGQRRDEIVDLAEDCDRMANQLRSMADAQRQLLHDISHELRSPLTRMNTAIGLLQQDPGQLQMLERIERESARMDELIEELLTLARLQSRPDAIEREELDVVSLLATIVEDAAFEASLKQATVRLQSNGPFNTRVDGELLYRAFENVIRNAVRHTTKGSEVVVIADRQDTLLTVHIIDHGPGVEEHYLQRMFQPFERSEHNTGSGFGLGLAIAQRAVQMHGGQITARNRPVGGLVVDILLPAS